MYYYKTITTRNFGYVAFFVQPFFVWIINLTTRNSRYYNGFTLKIDALLWQYVNDILVFNSKIIIKPFIYA